MGSNESKTASNIINEIVNESINTFINNNQQSLISTVDLRNISEIVIKGNVEGSIIDIKQKIKGDFKYVNEFNSNTASKLATQLENDLEQKQTQFMKYVSELGGGFGKIDKQILESTIKNVIKNVIRNTTTIANLNEIRNSLISENKSIVYIDGSLLNSGIKIDQSLFVSMFSKSLSKNITENIMNNSIANKVTQISDQKMIVEQKGISDLVKSLIAPMIIILIIIVIAIGGGMKTLVANVTNWKFILIASLLVITYLIIAYNYSFWPYKKYVYWGCENRDGMYTGKCVIVDDKNGFTSKEKCEERLIQYPLTCPQFWGCDSNDPKTNIPKQYKGIIENGEKIYGLYNSKEEAYEKCKGVFFYNGEGTTCLYARGDSVPPTVNKMFRTNEECLNSTKGYCIKNGIKGCECSYENIDSKLDKCIDRDIDNTCYSSEYKCIDKLINGVKIK